VFRNLISSETLVTIGAAVLALLAVIAVFTAALRLIRLATARGSVPDYAQRIQGPQERVGGVERGGSDEPLI
jgi:hypothetical protein